MRIEHSTYSYFNIATRLPALLEEFTYYWLQNPQRLATYAQTGSQSNSLFLSLYNTSPNGLDSFNHIHIFQVPAENIKPYGLIFSFKNKKTGLTYDNQFLSADRGNRNDIFH